MQITYTNILVAVLTLVLLVGVGFNLASRNTPFGSSPAVDKAGTNSSTTVGVAVATIFSADNSAQYRSISNIGTSTVYLWRNSTSTGFASSSPAGYALYPSSTLEMSEDAGNLWRGNIFGIAAAGTSTVTTSKW